MFISSNDKDRESDTLTLHADNLASSHRNDFVRTGKIRMDKYFGDLMRLLACWNVYPSILTPTPRKLGNLFSVFVEKCCLQANLHPIYCMSEGYTRRYWPTRRLHFCRTSCTASGTSSPLLLPKGFWKSAKHRYFDTLVSSPKSPLPLSRLGDL